MDAKKVEAMAEALIGGLREALRQDRAFPAEALPLVDLAGGLVAGALTNLARIADALEVIAARE